MHWQTAQTIRNAANKVLQGLRDAGQIGKSEEAVIYIHLEGPLSEVGPFIDSNLLRTICKVADVFFTKDCLESWGKQAVFDCKVQAYPIKSDPDYQCCQRCFRYNRDDNYSGLCDRCARIIINCYPERPEVYNILKYNRDKYGWKTDNLPEYIEQLKVLKDNGSNLDVFD